MSIYLLKTCDQWKSSSSMEDAFITASEGKLLSAIRDFVQEGDMLFGSEDIEESLSNIDGFSERHSVGGCGSSYDFAYRINDMLDYGYIAVYELDSRI